MWFFSFPWWTVKFNLYFVYGSSCDSDVHIFKPDGSSVGWRKRPVEASKLKGKDQCSYVTLYLGYRISILYFSISTHWKL